MTDHSKTEPAGSPDSNSAPKKHCVRTVRRQQGVSLRSLAKHLGVTISDARRLEDETNGEMTLDQLHAAHQTFPEVPIEDLLREPSGGLSSETESRAHFVRVMKTAKALSIGKPINSMNSTGR